MPTPNFSANLAVSILLASILALVAKSEVILVTFVVSSVLSATTSVLLALLSRFVLIFVMSDLSALVLNAALSVSPLIKPRLPATFDPVPSARCQFEILTSAASCKTEYNCPPVITSLLF